MQESLISIINDYGYLGIMFLILAENVFPPIPSEVVLLFGGYLTTVTDMNPFVVIIFATIGAVLGALVLYSLGYILKRDKLKALFSGRFGQILHLKESYIDLSYKWFVKYKNKAVLICRCIPVARSLISIPAGLSRMNLSVFLILSTLGTLIWNTVLVLLGNFMGDAWEVCIPYLKGYFEVVVAGVLILGALYIFYYKKKKRESGIG